MENRWIIYNVLVTACFLSVLLLSCAKEEAVPVVADFRVDIVNQDFSVPVNVVIINETTGADEYEWSFEGGIPETSLRRNPGTILYEKAGTYTILLTASNRDGIEEEKRLEVTVDDAVIIDFKAIVQEDNFSPVKVILENKTRGATSYSWNFEGGNPDTSDDRNPPEVILTTPGDHKISLEVSNEKETYTKDTMITVLPLLEPDFIWEVDFQDKDLQVPVKLNLENKSISATSYSWDFGDGIPANSESENANIVFETSGQKTITLTASNGKETKSISKNITLLPDTNLKVFKEIKLGINNAHNSDQIGGFFSATTEKVYSKSEVTQENGNLIDLVFFGLNADFTFNRFYSPDNVEDTTFESIPFAKQTKFINSQERCDCGTTISASQFDSWLDDSSLQNLTIIETEGGRQAFDNSVVPRIVLFETLDGRKGAVKINRFVSEGLNSYIETEIKIQKKSK